MSDFFNAKENYIILKIVEYDSFTDKERQLKEIHEIFTFIEDNILDLGCSLVQWLSDQDFIANPIRHIVLAKCCRLHLVNSPTNDSMAQNILLKYLDYPAALCEMAKFYADHSHFIIDININSIIFIMLHKSAINGYHEALHYLGCCYLMGIGALASKEKAVFYFRHAAAKGIRDSITMLGDYDVSSVEEAFSYYQKAYLLGSRKGAVRMAKCFFFGVGVEENKQVAMEMFNNPVMSQHPDFLISIGESFMKITPSQEKYNHLALLFFHKLTRLTPLGYDYMGELYDRHEYPLSMTMDQRYDHSIQCYIRGTLAPDTCRIILEHCKDYGNIPLLYDLLVFKYKEEKHFPFVFLQDADFMTGYRSRSSIPFHSFFLKPNHSEKESPDTAPISILSLMRDKSVWQHTLNAQTVNM